VRNKLLAFWVYYGTGIAIYGPLIVPPEYRTWRGNEISWDVFLPWYMAYAFVVLSIFVVTLGRIRRHCKLCWSLERAAEQTGRTTHELEQLVAKQNIQPLYTFDGVALYEPSELSEAARLLRPADISEDHLLRAASEQPCESANLVRAVEELK
jgi:hypothetical protein